MIRTENGQIEAKSAFLLLALVILAALGGLLIAKASIYISLLIIAIFVLIVTGFLSAEAALYLLIVSMLLSPEFIVGDLLGRGTGERGVTIRFDDLLLVVIGLGWFAKSAMKKELGLFLETPLNRPILFYIVVCLISTLIGFAMGRLNLKTGLFFVLKYFEYFIVYFMAVNHLRDKEQIKRFVMVMLAVCLVICVIAILQIPAGGRVTAPFEGTVGGEPNTLGGYLVLMLSITLGLLVTSDSMKRKTFLGVLVILIAISLLATLSRSSWLAMGPMLLTLIYFSKRRLVIVVPLVIITLILPLIIPHAVKERALYTVTQRMHAGQVEIAGIRLDTSSSARITSWKNILTKDFIKH
ncbi:MAG: O-antigen ligase family protein, partial [Syntrophales bacterium]|nr:O-antigen ligase family protein [Syntrophales bacterium]